MKTSITSTRIILLIFILSFQPALIGQVNWSCFSGENIYSLNHSYNNGGIKELPDGSIWFFVQKDGIYVYNNEWKKFDKSNYLIQNSFSSKLIDKQNRFWIGTKGPSDFDGWGASTLFKGGVIIYNIDSGEFEYLTKKEIGIPAPNVSRIYQDKDGAVWVAFTSAKSFSSNSRLHSGGIIKYHNEGITVYDNYPCDFCRFVSDIFEDSKGKLWFITLGGYMYFEDGRFYAVKKKEYGMKMLHQVIIQVIDDKKNFWVGTPGILSKWDGNKWTIYNKKSGLRKSSVPVSLFQYKGKMLYVTTTGLYLLEENNSWKEINFDNKVNFGGYSKRSPFYKGINRNGELVIYYWNNLGSFDGENWKQETTIKLKRPLLLDSKDRFWASSGDSLIYKENGEWLVKQIDGWGFVKDFIGNLWIITKKDGVYQFTGEDFIYYPQETFQNAKKITMVYYDSKNRLWIGTEKGICVCETQSN